MIKLLVADDHPVVRDGLVAVLETQPDFVVVGEAADGQQVLDRLAALDVDVLLLDLEMPVLDGVQVLEQLRQRNVTLNTLVFTAFDTDERIVGAIRAGARGYLLKGAPRHELFAAIRTIHAGGTTLQPIVAAKLIQHVQQASVVPQLTERERAVLSWLAQGMANKQIAQQLTITERTVKFHVHSLLEKFNASNRTHVVAKARELGMLGDGR